MVDPIRLKRSFFNQSTIKVARDLLGARLVKVENGERIGGLIIEAEAYRGETDLGCHAKAGITPRTKTMYGPPGHAYVYFTYGMHWMLNFVTEREGFPAAVLIRGFFPTEGIQVIESRRGKQPRRYWTDGPAKLCQALAIDSAFNEYDLCAPDSQLYVESGDPIPENYVTTGPRVGFNNVPEPWLSIPWRFEVVPDYYYKDADGSA
ncbi:MAG: DNA-3-methyladenine glycosylase [Chloroflexota bacterium]|nr:MAG: DNA-3-methyladenine glycosylase [Chloroflexota bacterium]